MKNFPTTLNPWYVVQYPASHARVDTTYHRSPENLGGSEETSLKREAMMFMSLQSAARVAKNTGGEIRALCSQEDAKEFGRD